MALISPRPSTLGQLLPVNPKAGADDSWYNKNADERNRKTCMIRLDILVSVCIYYYICIYKYIFV